jgi:hypothetical protein
MDARTLQQLWADQEGVQEEQIPAIADQWVHDEIGMTFKRVSNPKYEIDFTGERENLLLKCEMSIWVNVVPFKQPAGVESFLGLMTRLYELLSPAHGFAAHRSDYLSKNRLTYVHEDGKSTVEEWVGRDLHECLSGIYWANWFGPSYVDFLGREPLESTPCYSKTRLADGGYLVLTTASPLDYDTPEARQAEKEMREHLGPDRFYDIQYPARQTDSPWSSRFVA